MPEFISNELKGLFSLSIKRYFRWILLKSNYFFLGQKCKRLLLGGPSLPAKRLHALHAYVNTAWPRGEESRFNASFNVTLDASQSACFSSLVLQRTQITWTVFFFFFFLYLSDIFASILEN